VTRPKGTKSLIHPMGEVRSRSPDNGGGGTKSLIHPMGEVGYQDDRERMLTWPIKFSFLREPGLSRWEIW